MDSVFNDSNVTDMSKEAAKPTHYLNLHLVDAEGNEHRINTGIALGGRNEKRISEALIGKHNEDSEMEFQLVGRIKSAETEKVAINF